MNQAVPLGERTSLGALPAAEGTIFRLWSTRATNAAVLLYDEHGEVKARHAMQAVGSGVFEVELPGVRDGARYRFELDGEAYPDPYARWLPEGVHGPAEVWLNEFAFRHEEPRYKPEELVIYELHVGTFTPEGTYRAAAGKLPYLKELGVNCLELLPISSFPGARGWGYDGVAHFAPYREYGTPEDLQAFIDAAHGLGLTVILDVVYNHFGPDGNYLARYSPEYFTGKYETPWGEAPDYTNPFMRHYVLDSAEHLLREFRFDGFRLDATQYIYDDSPRHILNELAAHVHALGRGHYLFCEDYRNQPELVTEHHMDGIWVDDFHHQVRVCLTGETEGHFQCYENDPAELARCIEKGWLYYGQRGWPLDPDYIRGEPADELDASHFVYFIQNHDQIGNRALGDRMPETAGLDGFHAASALLLFLPMTPLLFQGQEWAASTPFQFFSDHHGELGKLVEQGRLEEFGHFESFSNPQMRAKIPNPQEETTFVNSKLNWQEPTEGEHERTLQLYRDLLRLRREDPVLRHAAREALSAGAEGQVLWVRREHAGEARLLLVNFAHEEAALPALAQGSFSPMLTTREWAGGALPPRAAVILAGSAA